jgi:hypothetical protein
MPNPTPSPKPVFGRPLPSATKARLKKLAKDMAQKKVDKANKSWAENYGKAAVGQSIGMAKATEKKLRDADSKLYADTFDSNSMDKVAQSKAGMASQKKVSAATRRVGELMGVRGKIDPERASRPGASTGYTVYSPESSGLMRPSMTTGRKKK